MAWWSRLLGRKDATPADADLTTRIFGDMLAGKTTSGVQVTTDTALKQSTAWACIRVRSEDIGKLPCFLYRRVEGGKGREKATDNPLYRLIAVRPNSRHTPMEFKAMMQLQLDTRGNALAVKQFSLRGDVTALWPVPWKNVTVLTSPDGLELFYRVRGQTGEETIFPAEGVIHLRGMSQDGLIGMSPIAYHRETIGLALAAEQYGAAFFGNNAQPSGVLKVKQVLSKEAIGALRADWEKRFRGPGNAHSLAVLDGEMDWTQIGMDNADAQFIETRAGSTRDICRIFRVPPHKVGDLANATFSNIEQQAIEYVTDCLLAEMTRWEETLNRDLLSEDEQGELYFKFLPDALLRGDLKSRYDAYAIGRNWGWLSADDVRDKEEMNPLPDDQGSVYLQPLNMVKAGTLPSPTTAALPAAGDPNLPPAEAPK